MRDKKLILRTMAAQRAEVEARLRAMPFEVLFTPCTDNGDSSLPRWTPKDHLAHLIRIERGFTTLGTLHRNGDGPPMFADMADKPIEELMRGIHLANEEAVAAYRGQDVEQIIAALAEARQDTIAFIDGLTEEQLDLAIPGAPWGDGTIGGVLMSQATHDAQHLSWVDEGLAVHR